MFENVYGSYTLHDLYFPADFADFRIKLQGRLSFTSKNFKEEKSCKGCKVNLPRIGKQIAFLIC